MKKQSVQDQSAAFERALKRQETEHYLLRLYVTGATPKSLRAIQNLKRICEKHLEGRYHLEVIDVYQQPVLARGEQIVAAPTLIKYLPTPLRKFIGDMSDTERILLGLDLKPAKESETENGSPEPPGTDPSQRP